MNNRGIKMTEQEKLLKRIATATERMATALETIAQCEMKTVSLSNKFADTHEKLNSVLNLIKGKPPEINKEEAIKKLEEELQPYND